MTKKPWVYAVIYLGLSLATEIVLLVFFRLKIPRDNHVIAPVVLIVPPLAAAIMARCLTVKITLLLAVCTSIITVLVTIAVTRTTGRSVGLLEPIVSRFTAGYLASLLFRRVQSE